MNPAGLWSLIIGLLGLSVSGAWTVRYRRQERENKPRLYWAVGLLSLVPAWLFAFVGLLPSSVDPTVPFSPPIPVLLCSATALLGVVFTDYALRRLLDMEPLRPPIVFWLLGMLSFAPSWYIALSNHLRI